MSFRRDVLVLGAGFGGLATAVELRRLLPSSHTVTLIDRRDKFSLGYMNLWLMVGEKTSPKECLFPVKGVEKRGVEFVNEEIVEIDVRNKRVTTANSTFEADAMVIALGAEYAVDEIPGLMEAGFNFYDLMGAFAAQKALTDFDGGQLAILITRTPFKCPPAPYEAAFLTENLMKKRNIRDKVSIDIYTPEPQPMPAAGKQVGQTVEQMLREKGIGFHSRKIVKKIDASQKKIFFEDGEVGYDLLLGVPPHRAPKVVRDAGLVDETGWVPIDLYTAATRFPDVYAIGDVAYVKLKNGMFLPKAGVLAEGMGVVAARRIAAKISQTTPKDVFDGSGYCFFEVGNGYAAKATANFYADPAPEVTFEPPTQNGRAEKERFGLSRLQNWVL